MEWIAGTVVVQVNPNKGRHGDLLVMNRTLDEPARPSNAPF